MFLPPASEIWCSKHPPPWFSAPRTLPWRPCSPGSARYLPLRSGQRKSLTLGYCSSLRYHGTTRPACCRCSGLWPCPLSRPPGPQKPCSHSQAPVRPRPLTVILRKFRLPEDIFFFMVSALLSKYYYLIISKYSGIIQENGLIIITFFQIRFPTGSKKILE